MSNVITRNHVHLVKIDPTAQHDRYRNTRCYSNEGVCPECGWIEYQAIREGFAYEQDFLLAQAACGYSYYCHEYSDRH